MAIGAPGSGSARPDLDHQLAGPATNDLLGRVLVLRNAAVSTSGDTEQFVEIGGVRYSHIVDPHTGIGLTERLQVSIVSRRATDTDAFATAVSVLGLERGLALVDSQPEMAALIVRKQGNQFEIANSKRLDVYLPQMARPAAGDNLKAH